MKTAITGQLRKIDAVMQEMELRFGFILDKVHPEQRSSAINLVDYLSLRNMDIRDLQVYLHEEGLSTLAYSEGHIRSQLVRILQHFEPYTADTACSYPESKSILNYHVRHLFGDARHGDQPYIMVTFQTSFAHDFIIVKKLLKAGMNIARINCAHDDEKTWLRMIKTVREASVFTGIPCRIYMDLAGPKIRTLIKADRERVELEEEDLFLLTDNPNLKSKLPVVGCTVPGIASQLNRGERIFFDDGLFEARVTGFQPGAVELEMVRVSAKKPFLKTEKGINFPDSRLSLSALTDFDRQCIPFVTEHADMVGYSFVHNTPDLLELQMEMKGRKIPVILKIETPEAFNNLPQLLLTAMREPHFGVMIARGDLAVEMGFEQMNEVQDEILRLCRAGHVPVILATQVLENMNKLGIPTRAEIIDASYGRNADCVMLNKGPYTAKVIKVLKGILQNNNKHFLPFHPVFKPLTVAEHFLKMPVK